MQFLLSLAADLLEKLAEWVFLSRRRLGRDSYYISKGKIVLVVLDIEPGALYMLGKCCH